MGLMPLSADEVDSTIAHWLRSYAIMQALLKLPPAKYRRAIRQHREGLSDTDYGVLRYLRRKQRARVAAKVQSRGRAAAMARVGRSNELLAAENEQLQRENAALARQLRAHREAART